jgi:hypothetical protein
MEKKQNYTNIKVSFEARDLLANCHINYYWIKPITLQDKIIALVKLYESEHK